MNHSEVIEKLKKQTKCEILSLTPYYFKDNQLVTSAYGYRGSFKVYLGSIYMNHKGEIQKVTFPKDRVSLKGKIDLIPQSKVLDHCVSGFESAKIVGYVSLFGVAKELSPETINDLSLSSTYKGREDKVENHGNIEAKEIFEMFCKKYQANIESVSGYYDSISYYRVSAKINGFSVGITLQKFFSYEISARIFEEECTLVLNDAEVLDLDLVLKELSEKEFSLKTKIRLALMGFKREGEVFDVNDQTLGFYVKDVNHRHRKNYYFEYNKTTKEISANKQSKKFVPQVIACLQNI